MNPQHTAVSPMMAKLSDYIAGALTRPLPAHVVGKAKAHIVDTAAAMVSGATLPPGERGIAYAREEGGTAEALVITTDMLTTAANAAFANAMLAHADETDDSHKASRSHLGCSVVPAALAMAEKTGASGEAFLRAVVLGYDIGARALFALNPLPFHQAGFCTHSFAGIFGSAAAAAALARLSPQQARWALSYAAQQAAGLSSWRRAVEHVEKAFVFAGMPAHSGVRTATMVASGFSGVNDVFTGAQNFFLAFGRAPKPELLAEELGERFEILGTTIKKWSVGSPVQSVLDGGHALLTRHHFDARDIATISVHMAPLEIDTVDNRAMPDISLQHLLSILLLDGDLTFASSHDEARMHDAAVVALKQKITLVPDAGREPRQAAVTITLADGRSFTYSSKAVHGTPENPMSEDEVTHKALGLIAPVVGERTAPALIDALWQIDTLGDVRALRPRWRRA